MITARNCFLLSVLLIFKLNVQAQTINQNNNIQIKNIPYPLKVFNSPLNLNITGDSVITITSKEKTNLFNSPGNNYYKQNAPMLLFHPDSNFILCAKISAELQEVYDVAALVMYQNNDLWAKLCYENSINKEATVVSVVTRGYSDDCNSIKIADNYIYFCIAKKGNEISFHCSSDNVNWYLVRHFNFDFNTNELMIGFAVHSSRRDMFSAKFSDINYSNSILENMRKYK